MKLSSIKKTAALTLSCIMLLSQTAYAATVTTAAAPGTANHSGSDSSVIVSGNKTSSPVKKSGSESEDNKIVIGRDAFNGASDESRTGVGPGMNVLTDQTAGSEDKTAAGASGNSSDNPIIIGTSASSATASNAGTTVTNNGQIWTAAPSAGIVSDIAKPTVQSQGAVLYDATTKQVLFDKNMNAALYPASTTKLMTALLAAEKQTMDATVTFSASAINSLESGAKNISMALGDTMTMKEALHAILLYSACDAANAIGEKVSSTLTGFCELMNQRAKELGCKNTHFTNTNGLNDPNHYSTAFDMALILATVLENETLRSILQTASFRLPATSKRSSMTIKNNNKMLKGESEYYEGFIGGKTGYTSKAGNCLASGVEYNSHRLIAVVLNSNNAHYTDTKALYDYGKKLIDSGAVAAAAASALDQGISTAPAEPSQKEIEKAQKEKAAKEANEKRNITDGKWEQEGTDWKYRKADGTYAKSEWLDINEVTYFFGADENMCTGWKQFSNGSWYYFNPQNGAMVKSKWVTQNEKSYYLQADGTMAKNKTIDGKYVVDENGVYIKNLE